MTKTRTVTRDKKQVVLEELNSGLFVPEPQDHNRSVELRFGVGVARKTGLHWHETQTEYIQILQGHAEVTVGDLTAVFGPDDGPIKVPKYTIHQYGRADAVPAGMPSRNVVLVVKEWTDPADGEKELFFRNVMGIIGDRKETVLGGIEVLLSLFTVFWYHDNYPVIWHGPRFMGKTVQTWFMRQTSYVVMRLTSLLGLSLGYRPDYDEYSPSHLSCQRAK